MNPKSRPTPPASRIRCSVFGKGFTGLAAVCLLAVQSVMGATLFWDGGTVDIVANGNGASGGTAGTWNTTLLNWDQGNALPHVAWSNSFADTAVFGGTAAAVTVSGTVQVGTLNVTSSAYAFNTGTIAVGDGGTGAGVVDLNNTNNNNFNATLSGKVKFQAAGGTGNLGTAASAIINGNNTGLTATELALNAAANHIIINGAGALGAAGATVKLTKGVLNLGNNVGGDTTLNAWTTDLAGGTIRARFNKYTWTGATSLSADSGLTTRGAAGVSLIFDTTATINLGGNTLTSDSDSLSAGITLNGVISGTGNIQTNTLGLTGGANGAGVTTLGAANTFSGTATTTTNRGTLALANVNALQNATLNTGASAGTQSVTFTVAGTNTYNLGALTGSDALAIGGNSISVGTKAVDTTFNADISGTGGGLVKVGANKLTLAASTSYTGATQVTGGTLALSGSGTVNGSSGITVNGSGAKFNASGSTAVSPTVTLTQGTLTGSGTVNTVNVGAGTGGIISNNDGVAGAALTLGTLTLAGGANIDLFSSTTAAALVVTTLTNNSASNAVTLTANNAGGWANGSTYNIIAYTALGGTGANNFAHAVNNLSARQSATWGDSGSAITLAIAGDTPYWVGDTNGNWNTSVTNNWRLVTGGGYTTFLANDDVLFNNNATGTRTIDITEAVATNTVVFDNNVANPYTIGSSGGFGITTGSLAKSGSGSVTLSTNNSYSGTTTVNAGILRATTSANALGAGGLVLTGGELQLANDTALNFGRNTTVSGNAQITSDTLTSSAGVTHTLGTLSLGANTLTIARGANATGTTAGVTFGATTLTGAATFSIGTSATLSLGAVANGAHTATFTGAGSFVQTGVWGNGAGGITFDSGFSGLATLNQANTYSGATSIQGGTVRATSSAAALGSGTLSLSGGELQLANDTALNFGRNTTVSGNAQITSDTLTSSAGVTHTLGTLSLGANTLTIAKGANATGTTARVAFGATTLTGAATFSIGTSATLSLGAVANGAHTATFTGAGSFVQTGVWGNGAGGITFDGSFTGLATLNQANTFTGDLTIKSGTVTSANATAITTSSSIILGDSTGTATTAAVLDSTSASYTYTKPIHVVGTNQMNMIRDSSFTAAYSGPITLTNANLTLNQATTAAQGFTGGITGTGNLLLSSTGTGGSIQFATAALNHTGTITNNGTGAATSFISSVIDVNVTGVTQNSTTSKLTLAGANTYTGPTLISAGTLQIGNGGATGSLSTSSTITTNGTLAFSRTNTITQGTDFASVIGGSGGVTQNSGVLILNGTNTYQGLTAVAGGVLTVASSGALGTTAGGTTVANGTRLELDGSVTVTGESISLTGNGGNFFGALQSKTGSNTWTGNITIAADAARIGAQSGSTLTVSGVIDDGASDFNVIFRPQSATASVIVSGANTYTGSTSIIGGPVSVASLNSVVGGTASSNLGAPVTVANGTIHLGGTGETGTLVYTGTGETTDRVVNLAGTTGGGGLDQSGTGLLKFTSDLTATGAGAKTLTLQGSTAGTGEIAGAIVNSTAATSLTKAGTGTWTLSGANTYTGITTLSAGTLNAGIADVAGVSGALGNGGDVRFTGGTLQHSTASAAADYSARIKNSTGAIKIDTNGQTVTFASALAASNSGGLTKEGTGTLKLAAANLYTGTSTINGGVLVAANTTALGAGNLVVATTGTLTVGNTGTRTQVDLAGSLSSSGTLEFDIFTCATGSNPLANNDVLKLTSASASVSALTGTLKVTNQSLTDISAFALHDRWTLIDWSALTTPPSAQDPYTGLTWDLPTGLGAGLTWNVFSDAAGLHVMVAPEPSRALLLLLGLSFAFLRRRRK